LKKVVIIIGASKSGSTLLAKTIGGHSQCFTMGEINRYNDEITNPDGFCGCGKPLGKCEFWSGVRRQFQVGETKDMKEEPKLGIFRQITKPNVIHKLLPTILLKKRYNNASIDKEIENTLDMYNLLFDKTGCQVLVDSTKGLFRALILDANKRDGIEFEFIHLVRDGRGVLNSSLKKTYALHHADGSVTEYHKETLEKPIYVKSPTEAINYWLYVNMRNMLLLKLFRKRQTVFVKYENFTKDPLKVLETVFQNLSLKTEKDMLDLGGNENHILGGNSSRLNAKRIKKVDDAWRTNLDKQTLDSFNKRAGWFNRLLGYN